MNDFDYDQGTVPKLAQEVLRAVEAGCFTPELFAEWFAFFKAAQEAGTDDESLMAIDMTIALAAADAASQAQGDERVRWEAAWPEDEDI